MTFDGKGFWNNMGSLGGNEATRLIARALGHGINFIDTADIYSFGASEEMMGHAIDVKREDVVIS